MFEPSITYECDKIELRHVDSASVKAHAKLPCLGRRVNDASGQLGGYSFETYAQVGARATNVSSALGQRNLAPGARIGLYSVNRPEWVIAEQGCFAQNLCTVPLYDTLGTHGPLYLELF